MCNVRGGATRNVVCLGNLEKIGFKFLDDVGNKKTFDKKHSLLFTFSLDYG